MFIFEKKITEICYLKAFLKRFFHYCSWTIFSRVNGKFSKKKKHNILFLPAYSKKILGIHLKVTDSLVFTKK